MRLAGLAVGWWSPMPSSRSSGHGGRACASRRGRSGGLREVLDDVRQVVMMFSGRGRSAYHPVRVRPSLGFALVPAPVDRAEPCRSDVEAWMKRARLHAPVSAADRSGSAAAAGLGEACDFDASQKVGRSRAGLGGLTSFGARAIEDLCALAQQDVGLYGMWTVTLPPDAAEALDKIDLGCSRWVDTVRRRFGETHRRACARESARSGVPVPSLWWFVVEPQKNGRPHIHLIFRSKLRRGRTWLLGRGGLDKLISNSLRSVTGRTFHCGRAGRVETIRSSMGRYLSKYLKKGARQAASDVVLRCGYSLNLVPLQWWGSSREAKAWLTRYVFELPAFVSGRLASGLWGLVAAGWCDAGVWAPPIPDGARGPGPPLIVVGRWRSGQAMVAALRALLEIDGIGVTVGPLSTFSPQ